jgi:hypothetical protein
MVPIDIGRGLKEGEEHGRGVKNRGKGCKKE